MMLGEPHRPDPTVNIPPWSLLEDPTSEIHPLFHLSGVSINSDANANAGDYSPLSLQEALRDLHRYLPSNEVDIDSDPELSGFDSDGPVDAYSCDHFRMFEFKVRRCAHGKSHDWTQCPYAHPGEKAHRRDPRKYHYSGTACPDYRKGNCEKGDSCEFAHGVFECWLHPARYRTQPCKDGTSCRRRVCFFAHTPEQLRVLPQLSSRNSDSVESYDGSPLSLNQAMETSCVKPVPILSSALSISPQVTPAESPPLSPMTRSLSRAVGSNSANEMVASFRNLQLGLYKSSPPSHNFHIGSPYFGSITRSGFCSMPTTPTQVRTRAGIGNMEPWDHDLEEEPVMERVESGRGLRAKMYEKLSKENSLDRVDP